jgi:hypothetical protein
MVCAAGTFWMERHSSLGSIGERLTPAIRTDAGASKSDLRLRSARLPFSTPASMIAGIVLVDEHSFHYPSTPRLCQGYGFFKFLSFRMQLFQKHTLPHKLQCNLSRFTLHGTFLFSDIVIWPSRGSVCFRPRSYFSVPVYYLTPPPPSQFCTYTTVSLLLRWSRRIWP